jgi:PST family polysaccharide transporter
MSADSALLPEVGNGKTLLNRISSNVKWSLLSEVGGKGILFLATIYLARVLGVENFGIFSFGQTMVTYAWLAVNLGTNMYGIREVAQNDQSREGTLNELLSIRLSSGFIIFSFFNFLTLMLGSSSAQKMAFFGFSFYLIFRALFTEWFLRGLEKYNYIAIGNLLTFGLFLGACFIFVKDQVHFVRAAFLWSFSWLIGGIALLLMSAKAQKGIKIKLVFSWNKWWKHLRESLHFTLSGGLSTIYQQLPIFLIGIFSTDYNVGLFSAAHRLIISLVFVFSVYPMAIYPILSDLHIKNRSKFNKIFSISLAMMLFLSFVSTIVIIAFSEKISVLILGKDYADASLVLQIVAGFFLLRSVREVFVIAISASGLQRYYTIASVFAVISITMIFFIMNTFFGVNALIAASISLSLTEFFVLLIMIRVFIKGGASLQ